MYTSSMSQAVQRKTSESHLSKPGGAREVIIPTTLFVDPSSGVDPNEGEDGAEREA